MRFLIIISFITYFTHHSHPILSNKMVWNTVALTAPDQLRHRVAWALSSIFVVTENDISLDDIVEAWAVYYDIFVRHAFGSSFFTVLKEIALSPLMGRMLTYEGKLFFVQEMAFVGF